MPAKQSKKMYSISNMEGTYEDLVGWFNNILKQGEKNEISRYELINFLNTKGRVPLAIMKKNKPPKTQQPRCIARVLKDFSQCKNESEQGTNCFCKIHTIRRVRYTIKKSVDEIEQEIEQERLQKQQQAKLNREQKKKNNTVPSNRLQSNRTVSPKKTNKRVKKIKKIKKIKKAVNTDNNSDIDFGDSDNSHNSDNSDNSDSYDDIDFN